MPNTLPIHDLPGWVRSAQESMLHTKKLVGETTSFVPRSLDLSKPIDISEEPDRNWTSELWQTLLDAHGIIFDIGKHVSLLDKSAVLDVQTITLPSNESLELHERDLDRLSTNKTEAIITDIVVDFLLESLFIDQVWKPIKNYVCHVDFKKLDLKANPTSRVVLDIHILHLVFLSKVRHISLLVKQARAPEFANTYLMREGLETLRKLVAYVDEMSQHLHLGESAQNSMGSELLPPPAHIGSCINSECWRIHLVRATFDVSSMYRYISWGTRTFLLGLMHVATIVMMLYFRWPVWISFVLTVAFHAIIQYGYFAGSDPATRQNDESHLAERTPQQIYALHALLYAYLHLSVKEATYMLSWLGLLCGINHFLGNWSVQRKFSQAWATGAYDAMAIYYVICGVHLKHGWLTLALGTWLAGSFSRASTLSASLRFNLIAVFAIIDVPLFFLFIYLVQNVSFIHTAYSFLYQLFVPFVVEVAFKWIMDMLGWQSSPIDLSGSAMRGVTNVLMAFWGFSSMQAFTLMMVMQVISSLRAIAPQYGMT